MPHRRLGAKSREGYYKWIVEKAEEEGRDAVEYYHEQRDQNSEANKLFSMNLAKSRDDAMMKKMSYVRTPEEQRRYDIQMKELPVSVSPVLQDLEQKQAEDWYRNRIVYNTPIMLMQYCHNVLRYSYKPNVEKH